MPRRKKTISDLETASLPPAQAQEATPADAESPTPTRRRRRKTTEPAPEPAQVAVEPNAPELPKRTRRRRSTDSPVRAETTANLDTSAQATKPTSSSTDIPVRAETTTNLDSPVRAETTANLDTSAQATKPTSSSTDSPVRAETTANLDSPVRAETTTNLDSPVRAETTTNLDSPVHAETTANLDSPVRAETTANLDSPVHAETTTNLDSPVHAETTTNLDTSAQATKPKRTRRRKKAGSTAAEASASDGADAIAPAIEAQPSTDSADAVAPTIEDAPAKKPRRTRKRKPAETPAEAGESAKEPPSEPEPPPRPPIRHPRARVQFQNGVPTILFGERAFAPHFFFGNPYSPEAAVRVQQQIQLAAEAGVHLYSLLITLPVRETGAIEAFDQIRYWTALARETDPDAHFLWRIAFAPTNRWYTEYPEAVIRFADGSSGGPSVCADRWWQVAKAQLVTLVELVEQQDEGGATLGYHLDYGEWFLSESGGYDTSEAALGAFREWLRRQYKGDSVVLRACWFNGEVSFSTATLPPFQPAMPQGRIQHFYHPRREGRWIDYHRFLSDITARRIIGLAQAVKDASQRRALVGAPYGYVLEWKHPYAGHFALNQILQSEHIDLLSAPLSYTSRLPGELGALPTPVESVNLHGKLFISEEDYRTPFGKTAHATDPSTGHHLGSAPADSPPDDDYNPPLHTAHTVQQVHTRSLAQSLALAHGEMWMDLWGEGWLAHPDAWNAARNAVSLWNLRLRAPQTPPEVAVIIDPESTRYVRTGSPLIEQMVVQAREAVLRSGASVGFYLLEDITRRDFPPSRVVIFLNAWRMSRAAHEAIRKRLQRDGRVLIWLYASTLFHGHRDALASARETLGVAIARQPWASMQGTQVVNKAHPLARFLGADKLGAPEPWEPSFYAIAEGCDAVGEYVDTGLPSLAVCDHKTWKAVFLGERRLTPELVRALVRWAGGHIWLDGNDLVQARYPWVHVHARKSGARTLQFPMPLSVYDTAEAALVTESVMEHTLYLQEGESRLLLVAPHELMLRLLQGEPIQLPPYFELTETPDVSEPVVESAAPTLEPDWEEPVLEPIALEESPFEPVETHDVLAPEAEPASEPSGAERRSRRRTRGRRGKPARAQSAQKSTPATPTDSPIIVVQWRRSSEDS